MRCDTIAQGIVAAQEELQIKVPVVMRLQGIIKNLIFMLMEMFKVVLGRIINKNNIVEIV